MCINIRDSTKSVHFWWMRMFNNKKIRAWNCVYYFIESNWRRIRFFFSCIVIRLFICIGYAQCHFGMTRQTHNTHKIITIFFFASASFISAFIEELPYFQIWPSKNELCAHIFFFFWQSRNHSFAHIFSVYFASKCVCCLFVTERIFYTSCFAFNNVRRRDRKKTV